jgi:CysZ protein
MSGSLIKGASYVLTGLRWLPKAGLRGFVMLPLAINALLFSGGLWWSAQQMDRLDQALQNWLPSWLQWLHWVLWPLFILTAFVVVFYGFSLVANLLAAPFNSLLSERVQKMMVSSEPLPSPSISSWRDWLFSPFAEIGKILHVLIWLIPLIILMFVPGANLITPVLWLLSTAWGLALGYADYPLSNRGIGFKQQRHLLRQHWPLTLGFGAMTLLLTLVPVLNFFVMPAAVIGATLMWNQELSTAS